MTKTLAILRTYYKEKYHDTAVMIDEDHDFSGGPYQDTIPFPVGSNQEIVPIDDLSRDAIQDLLEETLNDQNTSLFPKKYQDKIAALKEYIG